MAQSSRRRWPWSRATSKARTMSRRAVEYVLGGLVEGTIPVWYQTFKWTAAVPGEVFGAMLEPLLAAVRRLEVTMSDSQNHLTDISTRLSRLEEAMGLLLVRTQSFSNVAKATTTPSTKPKAAPPPTRAPLPAARPKRAAFDSGEPVCVLFRDDNWYDGEVRAIDLAQNRYLVAFQDSTKRWMPANKISHLDDTARRSAIEGGLSFVPGPQTRLQFASGKPATPPPGATPATAPLATSRPSRGKKEPMHTRSGHIDKRTLRTSPYANMREREEAKKRRRTELSAQIPFTEAQLHTLSHPDLLMVSKLLKVADPKAKRPVLTKIILDQQARLHSKQAS